MKDIKHTPIQTILTAAEPVLEERTQKWVIRYNEARVAQIAKKAELKEKFDALTVLEQNSYRNETAKAYRQFHVRPEMTEYIRESYKIGLQMDLIKAMANYLLKTDIIASEPVFDFDGKNGDLTMTVRIGRNGQEYRLFTHVILVQGDIKVWHYRYRVETELAKINAAPYLNWLQKVDKFESEIASKEAYIARLEEDNRKREALTYEEFRPTSQYYRWLSYPEVVGNVERMAEIEEDIKREFRNAIRTQWNNKDIKSANAQIIKLRVKIEALNAANI